MRDLRLFLIGVVFTALLMAQSGVAQSGASFQSNPPVFTSLLSFDFSDGSSAANTDLTQATDGNFYGVTELGGTNGKGTIFKLTPSGALTTIYSFCSLTNCSDGSIPSGGLVQAPDGQLYGVTAQGGVNGVGTLYTVTLSGSLTTLHSFESSIDGAYPIGALVQANGYFYGITEPYSTATNAQGTIFKASATGTVSTMYNFCSQANCADGTYPAALMQASDGNFYGTTTEGGSNSTCLQTQSYGCGTVYRLTPSGVLTTLHSFAGYPNDGNGPQGTLIQANDRNLYGSTFEGGSNNYGTTYRVALDGTETTIYSFCPSVIHDQCPYGRSPYAGLTQAANGNLYGVAYAGGRYGYGTVYRMTLQGTLTVEHSFDATDGAYPGSETLLQATDGTFYGATENDGAYNYGTLFHLNDGFPSFVKTQTSSGKVGSTVIILGTNLTGTSNVTFNGISSSSFEVLSSGSLSAVVPTGATTGFVLVTTPGGTLKSNHAFRVIP